MGDTNNILPPHLNAEIYRTDIRESNAMSNFDYIKIHPDGTTLIGCSELSGRYWKGAANISKSVEEAACVREKDKYSISLVSGNPDGCFIYDSNKVLLCEDSGRLSVWAHGDNLWSPWEELIGTEEHDDSAMAVQCLHAEHQFVTVGADGNIKIWDINDMVCTTNYSQVHSMIISDVSVRPEHDLFATSSLDRHVSLWDSNSTTKISDVAVLECGVRAVSWLNEHWLLVGDEAGVLSAVDVRRPGQVTALTAFPAPVHRIVVQPQSNKAAICCDNRSVSVFEVDGLSAKCVYEDRQRHRDYARGAAWDAREPGVLHSVGWDGLVLTHNM